MSNRELKIKLFNKNPYCHYCGQLMFLTSPSAKSLPPNGATIEHRISRLNPARWRRKRPNEKRRVLACYECNHNRSELETLCMSRKEILQRSKGFSLNPRGKPKITKPAQTINEVNKILNGQT
jgi:hypothetical protein